MSWIRGRPDRTPEAFELLAQIARAANVDVPTLRSRSQDDIYIKIRRDFCVRGRAMGLLAVELGIALNREYTTVSYHSRPEIRAAKKARHPIYRANKRKLQTEQRSIT